MATAHETGRATGLAPLRVRDFRLLFTGLVIGQSLMPMQFVTQIFWVQTFVDDGYRVLLIGLLGTIRGAGALSFGLYGGALADRFDRRKLLMTTQGSAFGLNLVIAGLMATGNTGPVTFVAFFLLTFVAAGFMAIDAPTRNAMVPDLLGPRMAPAGISMNSAGMQVALPMSMFASGFLIDAIGFAETYALSTIGHLVQVVALAMMTYKTVHAGIAAGRGYGLRRTFSDVREGIAYTRGHPTVLWIILLMVATVGLGFPATANLGPTWVTTVVGVSIRNFGFISITWGLGAFIASVLLTRYALYERKGAMLSFGSLGFALSFLIFAVPQPAFAILGNLGLGASLAICQVCSMSLVQHLVANEMRGRVMSLLQMNMGFAQLMTLPLAAIAATVSLEVVFPALALAVVALVIVINASHRQIWRAVIPAATVETAPAGAAVPAPAATKP